MVEAGIAPDGQIVLTYQLETKAAISFSLDTGQARSLIDALSELIGHTPNRPPQGKAPH
jgi:hypothetical protein